MAKSAFAEDTTVSGSTSTPAVVSISDDERSALKELYALLDSPEGPMPAGIPMSPVTRQGRLLLKRLEGLSARL